MIDHLLLHVHAGPGGGFACGVLYDFASDRYRPLGPDAAPALRQTLLSADLVSGLGLLSSGYAAVYGERAPGAVRMLTPRTQDLGRNVELAMGQPPGGPSSAAAARAWDLSSLARGTLGKERLAGGQSVGNALAAGDVWGACALLLDDAALLRELCLFEARFGYLVNGRSGAVLRTRAAAARTAASFDDRASHASPLAPGATP